MIETIIAVIALGISAITFVVNMLAMRTKASKEYSENLKKTITNHEERIEKLEWLLKQCETERESIRKEHYHALQELTEAKREIRRLRQA